MKGLREADAKFLGYKKCRKYFRQLNFNQLLKEFPTSVKCKLVVNSNTQVNIKLYTERRG